MGDIQIGMIDTGSSTSNLSVLLQIGMIDTSSSTSNLSVLLSAMETSFRTQTGLEIAQ